LIHNTCQRYADTALNQSKSLRRGTSCEACFDV
jgi:hypothetical protein